MSKTLRHKGYLSVEELCGTGGMPDQDRLSQGPVAVIECVEQIPCDPCISACPQGAIGMEAFVSVPILDGLRCTGCGLCLAICPGQAIFLVDMTYGPDQAAVTFPYEYLPLPRKGQTVAAVSRDGSDVIQAEVVRVRASEATNKTALVTVAVPRELADRVRSMRRLEEQEDE